MPEKYEIALENGRISFALPAEDIPEALLKGGSLPEDYSIFTRMGDPELLECAVWRDRDARGGIFVIRAAGVALFAAAARSELVFAQALGYFGDLVAKVRYGADIFENMDEDHD